MAQRAFIPLLYVPSAVRLCIRTCPLPLHPHGFIITIATSNAGAPEVAFDYFADCIFIVDVTLSFMTTYKEDGVYVNDR